VTFPARIAAIGTTTEIVDYLRLLYAKIAKLFCPMCGRSIERTSPEVAAQRLLELPEGTRLMIAFASSPGEGETPDVHVQQLQADGFVRAVVSGRTTDLTTFNAAAIESAGELLVIVDRVVAGQQAAQRQRDSLETAFNHGGGRAIALVEGASPGVAAGLPSSASEQRVFTINDQPWQRLDITSRLECTNCQRAIADPEPRRFSFNSPLGACPTCEGFGNLVDWDLNLIVPDPARSIREGAIAPWNTPAYKHELDELLALASDYQIPADVPFRELPAEALRLIREGVPERNFGGLRGFFNWLEKRKYKLHLRVFLNRWRSSNLCPTCRGNRLNEEALAWRIQGQNIADVCQLRNDDAIRFFTDLPLGEHDQRASRTLLARSAAPAFPATSRPGIPSPDRTLKTLSGEA
jgi:excinuclease ABC subunit A